MHDLLQKLANIATIVSAAIAVYLVCTPLLQTPPAMLYALT